MALPGRPFLDRPVFVSEPPLAFEAPPRRVGFRGDPAFGERRRAACEALHERRMNDELLARPVFIEGAPPEPEGTAHLHAGAVEARRRRALGPRTQGGDPDPMGVATRKGEVGGPTKDLPTALTCGNGMP